MWFDPHAKLAAIEGRAPATPATPATNRAEAPPRVADVADVATPRHEITPDELARGLFEERAAIRENCDWQGRVTGGRQASGDTCRDSTVVWLHRWRDAADDITNPEVWR